MMECPVCQGNRIFTHESHYQCRDCKARFQENNLPDSHANPKRPKQRPEAELQRAGIQLIEDHGFFPIRINPGGFYRGETYVKAADPGIPDVFFAAPPRGRMVAVEFKVDAPLTPDQRAFLATLGRLGGIPLVCTNLECLDEDLRRLLENPQVVSGALLCYFQTMIDRGLVKLGKEKFS